MRKNKFYFIEIITFVMLMFLSITSQAEDPADAEADQAEQAAIGVEQEIDPSNIPFGYGITTNHIDQIFPGDKKYFTKKLPNGNVEVFIRHDGKKHHLVTLGPKQEKPKTMFNIGFDVIATSVSSTIRWFGFSYEGKQDFSSNQLHQYVNVTAYNPAVEKASLKIINKINIKKTETNSKSLLNNNIRKLRPTWHSKQILKTTKHRYYRSSSFRTSKARILHDLDNIL